MSEYLLINLVTIAAPLILSFESKIAYYKKFPSLFLSIISVGTIFIVWDAIATLRGDWSFNEKYIGRINFFYLPVEEILFFITIPFAEIFLYETVKLYLKEKVIQIHSVILISCMILLLAGAIYFHERYYTSTVLIFSAIAIALNLIPQLKIFSSKIYWLWIAFMYIPFFVVNYILTSLPIVSYSASAIWGNRFLTIPFEDFFYSFSMLTLYLIVYNFFEQRWKRKKLP